MKDKLIKLTTLLILFCTTLSCDENEISVGGNCKTIPELFSEETIFTEEINTQLENYIIFYYDTYDICDVLNEDLETIKKIKTENNSITPVKLLDLENGKFLFLGREGGYFKFYDIKNQFHVYKEYQISSLKNYYIINAIFNSQKQLLITGRERIYFYTESQNDYFRISDFRLVDIEDGTILKIYNPRYTDVEAITQDTLFFYTIMFLGNQFICFPIHDKKESFIIDEDFLNERGLVKYEEIIVENIIKFNEQKCASHDYNYIYIFDPSILFH